MKTHWIILLGLALSLFVLHTAARIEYWNYRAGWPLPKEEPGKLRGSRMGFESWKREEARRTGDQSLLAGRSLTPEEQESFYASEKHAKALGHLVDWTRGPGMLQYLLAPLAFGLSLILSLTCVERKARWLFAVLTVTNALAIFLMFFHGYYTD